MEKSYLDVPSSDNGNGSHDLKNPSAIKNQHTSSATGVVAVHELGNVIDDTLQMKDQKSGTGSRLPSDNYCSGGLEDQSMAKSKEKTPISQLRDNSYTSLLSLPKASKIVSAMKGSREKEGEPPMKLSVSWAPDVYDPLPTSLSHLPKKKNQQHFKSNKKHGKGKQKGKKIRGGGSDPKDKKHHHRKMGGRSERSNGYKSSVELLDFDDNGDDDIGGSDSNHCGSSFLGENSTSMHFALAEAT